MRLMTRRRRTGHQRGAERHAEQQHRGHGQYNGNCSPPGAGPAERPQGGIGDLADAIDIGGGVSSKPAIRDSERSNADGR